MLVEIFDMDNGEVIIGQNALMIPEFKAIVDKYSDPISALRYVHFMTSLESPYRNVPEADRQQIVSDDVGGDFSFDDEEIVNAVNKAELLYTTPTKRFYLSGKIGLEKMGDYLKEQEITSGRDGNDSTFMAMLKGMAIINKNFKEVEKDYNEEVQAAVRGGRDRSFDE